MKLYKAKPWQPRWWLNLIVRGRIRRFVRECRSQCIFNFPVLDVGAGYRSNKPEVGHPDIWQRGPEEYDTLDLERELNPKFVGDVCDMDMIDDETYGSVICTEVLEHVVDPRRAMSEIYRVIRHKGTVVITVPFWYPIHEKPFQQDYWRFTERGLRELMNSAGFKNIYTDAAGPRLRPTGIFAHGVKL